MGASWPRDVHRGLWRFARNGALRRVPAVIAASSITEPPTLEAIGKLPRKIDGLGYRARKCNEDEGFDARESRDRISVATAVE